MTERRAITVQGVVQGVGFRPFVFGLAARLGLAGSVKNRTGGVVVEVEGDPQSLDRFLIDLESASPPLAQIHEVRWERQATRGESRFRIDSSEPGATGAIFIAPDVATCDACLAELFDPANRRYRYPFLNCTNCGPRLTIVQSAPYDRERTTMSGFAMCRACRAEYDDPADRRFHAQPTACPLCGPQLALLDHRGEPIAAADPLICFAAALGRGEIGAIKGLGGYHLACAASSASAVGALRVRKHRDEKPFAVMVADLAAARELCEIDVAEQALLLSPRRPIVLLRKRTGAGLAESVAPRNPYLGVMLPYTPLHHLLLRSVGRIPLVMTSGNRQDEPIAHEDADAVARLAGIASLLLTHNRPIHVRCEDSVTRIVGERELPLRRSRGYAPLPIDLPHECPCPTLAVGGQLKGSFALGQGRHAFLSHHLGDLDHYEAYRAFERDIALYRQLFAVQPESIAHDLHPDYASTRFARVYSSEHGTPLVAVQHHHAHMASVMAEHGLTEPVIAVTFDGTGYGTDGAIWGGEFLAGDYGSFRRAAHLRYAGMPGGDQAIREPWRMAAAHLLDAHCGLDLLSGRVSEVELRAVETMLARGLNTPLTSSAGRLFDAVAALAGVRDRVTFEGQAAMELEWLAMTAPASGCYAFELSASQKQDDTHRTLLIDTRPMIQDVASDALLRTEPAIIARRFHTTMVELIVATCVRIRERTRLDVIVLSGGVFMNALLAAEVCARLASQRFRVYTHHRVPPNDGGLCLGQLAVAASRLTQG